jgi:hypothetical protein
VRRGEEREVVLREVVLRKVVLSKRQCAISRKHADLLLDWLGWSNGA